MREPRLKQLLQSSEADIQWDRHDPAQLAVWVRDEHARRERHRRAVRLAVVAATLLISAGIWGATSLRQGAPPRIASEPLAATNQPAGNPAPAPHESLPEAISAHDIARLQNEVALHARLARELIAGQAHAVQRETTHSDADCADPIDQVRLDLDLVAVQMVSRADRLRERNPMLSEVLSIYQNVIQLFPATHSAVVAQQRVAELNKF